MGVSMCYLASRLEPEAMAEALDLEIVKTATEEPNGDSWIATIKASGWSVFWCEDFGFSEALHRIKALAQLSDVICCQVEERAMWSSTEFWSGGVSQWRVMHGGGDDDDPVDLKIEGSLPTVFEDINTKYVLLQKADSGCDYGFEIPLELAAHFINFRHEDILTPDRIARFHMVGPLYRDPPEDGENADAPHSAPTVAVDPVSPSHDASPGGRSYLARIFGRRN